MNNLNFSRMGERIVRGLQDLQNLPGNLKPMIDSIVEFVKNPSPPVPKKSDVRMHMHNQPPERPPLPENISKFNFNISNDPSSGRRLEHQLINLANARAKTDSFIATLGKEIYFNYGGDICSQENSIAQIGINEEGKFYIALKGDGGRKEVSLDGVKLNIKLGGNFVVLEPGIQHKFQIGDKIYEFKIEDKQG